MAIYVALNVFLFITYVFAEKLLKNTKINIFSKHRLVLFNTPLINTYKCSFKCYTISVCIKEIWFRPLGVNLLLLCNIVVPKRTFVYLYLLTTCGTLIQTPTSIMKSA